MKGLGILILILLVVIAGGCSLFLFMGAVALGFKDGVGLGLLGLLALGFCVALIKSLFAATRDPTPPK